MAFSTTIRVTHAGPATELTRYGLGVDGPGQAREACSSLSGLFTDIAAGRLPATVEIIPGTTAAVHASQTYTFSAAPAAADTYVVNGVTFTARASAPAANEFIIGTSKTTAACALAAVINGSASAGAKQVFAVSQGDYATGTATLSTVVATNAVTLAGVTFTYTATPSATSETDVLVTGGDTVAAAALAAKVNANTYTNRLVKATSSGAVVTFTALTLGSAGNAIALAKTGAPITVSAAALAGGAGTVGATMTTDALPALGVCKVYAKVVGSVGNSITTTKTSVNCAVGGATLAGGAGEDTTLAVFNRS